MKKIGITGQHGFIGYHLYQSVKLLPQEFQLIEFDRSYFNNELQLDRFVSECDAIVHLAALNRHNDPEELYRTNTEMVDKLTMSLERTMSRAHVIISSSTQEARDNLYGKSKREGRLRISEWASNFSGIFTGMIIPNVFGPFGSPYYNSVVATFCHQLAIGEKPQIVEDANIKLIYVGELVEEIINAIRNVDDTHERWMPNSAELKVSELLALLQYFNNTYQQKGEFPKLNSPLEYQLFNTFRSYINIENYFPKRFIKHTDERGAFIEIARLGIPGQTSFSTTFPGITRGNHFHTRKIERFAVISGKALIQLRKIGTNKIFNFYIDGSEPAYVDMPIWYTHNIQNVGDDTLYTIFWINEAYDPKDPDTYFETV